MSAVDDYRDAMDMVKKVEAGPVSKFSAETRCFASLVRAVDNYHRETQERADRLQAELTEVKGKLSGMPRPVLVGDGKQGWTLEYNQIFKVYELARNVEQVSMEDVEAIMVAMVDARLAHMTHEGRLAMNKYKP